MTKMELIRQIIKTIKDTDKQLLSMEPQLRDSIDADMEKTIKAMAYTTVSDIVKNVIMKKKEETNA